jgi:hypothetical protein
MSQDIWVAVQNLLTAAENNSSAIEALARSSRSNREYIEALVHTQVVMFQLLMKEMDLSPKTMEAHFNALSSNEETPAAVRTLLQLHGEACAAATAEDEATPKKKRPDWYQGVIDGDNGEESGQQAQEGPSGESARPDPEK